MAPLAAQVASPPRSHFLNNPAAQLRWQHLSGGGEGLHSALLCLEPRGVSCPACTSRPHAVIMTPRQTGQSGLEILHV